MNLGAGASATAAMMKEDTPLNGQAMEKLWLSLEEAQKRLAARSTDLQAERETTASLRRRVPVLLQSVVCVNRQAHSWLAAVCTAVKHHGQAQHALSSTRFGITAWAANNTWAVQRLQSNVQAPQYKCV